MVSQRQPRSARAQSRRALSRRALSRPASPLRRPVDRIEAIAVGGLLAAFAIAAPLLATLSGVRADAAAVHQQQAEQSWHHVAATLQQSASQGLVGASGAWGISWVTARWAAPDGTSHSGRIAVPLDARAGDRVDIWETGTGQLTHQPLSHVGVIDRVTFAVFWVVVWVSGLFALLFFGTRGIARRCRMAGWAREWAAFGSRWSQLR
ncbi:MAG TPA: hypothetical protein VGI58_21120 [Streptosporangiaceae bacterium]